MKTLFAFLKTTILGGVFFLLPMALVAVGLNKILQFVAKFVKPLAKLFPFESVSGIETPYLLAIFFLLIVSFLAGLIGRTALGTRMRTWLENTLLQLIPGYTLLRGLTEEEGNSQISHMSTALLGGGGKWDFCFIVERHPNGYLTIFKPGAPSPTRGSVSFVSPEQVREVDVPVAEVMKCLMRDGGGAERLLRGKLKS